MKEATIDVLVGKTFSKVDNLSDEILRFTSDEGRVFEFYHSQGCCESVTITDICGDLTDLVGSPVLQAVEENSPDTDPTEDEKASWYDSYTWTFYRFTTIKGTVTVRWLGTSNGYYSESVDFRECYVHEGS